MHQPVLIGVDWGTSNLRVLLIGADGAVIDRRADPRGAGGLPADAFAGVLDAVAGDWLARGLPVVVCGMAGARGRWREAPYVPCPASAAELAAGLVRPDPDRDLAIVPGVALTDEDGLVDVMRGEETQALGLGLDDALVIAPGTHSKWIGVEDGRLTRLRTFLTGELFAALKASPLIGAGLGETDADPDAFARGVRRGLDDPALLAALFSTRVEQLAGRLAASGAADYLSGLLIGAEIAAQRPAPADSPVAVVGAPALAESYLTALAVAGVAGARRIEAETATARGLWRIWDASR